MPASLKSVSMPAEDNLCANFQPSKST